MSKTAFDQLAIMTVDLAETFHQNRLRISTAAAVEMYLLKDRVDLLIFGPIRIDLSI